MLAYRIGTNIIHIFGINKHVIIVLWQHGADKVEIKFNIHEMVLAIVSYL